MVEIQNSGVKTIVTQAIYENVYKPKGWTIVGEHVEYDINKELASKGLVNEKQQNEYVKAKIELSKRHFTDGLFKDGS